MKIAIDAFPAMLQKTGVGYYTEHLITAFLKFAPDNDYYLCDFLGGKEFYQLVKVEPDLSNARDLFRISNVRFPFVTLARVLLYMRNRALGRIGRLEEADLFFGTNYRGVFLKGMKNVITIHDMAHEHFPDAVPGNTLRYLKERLPEVARSAALLIADSEATKDDVVTFLNVPEQKVRVIYLGVDTSFRKIADREILTAARERYRLPERFILFLGTIQPRKNLEGLIKAFALLCKEKGFEHSLVVAGGQGWKSGGLKALIKKLGLDRRVRFIGYVDGGDMPALYNLADLFVFPSLYEGFGLPVLEAMACGVPVVTSRVSSLPEVAGDAAVLVDPSSGEDIAEGMRRLLSGGALRDQCVEKSLERAKLFTWERCAHETLAVFKEVMEE
jgi:glycosyltransferase involved in cell wall biosynthesis